MSQFKNLIRLIADGENVSAATTNRVFRELAGNIEYVKSVLESSLLGEAVYARDVTVESDAQVGMPVYWHPTRQRFERALAAASQDTDSGFLVPAVSTQVWGVVSHKHNATLADLVLRGTLDLDISAAAGTVTAGVYYLSGTTAGALVKQSPGISVPVLQSDGEDKILVNPQFTGALDAHRHFRYELVCRPAGVHAQPTPGDRHEITSPDDEIEGWLPATHAVFDGKAPGNALFGYNLSASPLANYWPPSPLNGAWLEMFSDLHQEGGVSVQLGTSGQCLLDANGIWWLSDCYQDVPWPYYWEEASDSETSDISSDVPECPRAIPMQLILWFSKPSFYSQNTVVTSLSTPTDSKLSITCNGAAATTGNLVIDLDLDFVSTAEDAEGHIVIKSFDGEEFERGPVVEGLVAGSGISLTSDNVTDDDVYQGIVTVSSTGDVTDKELAPSIVQLQGAVEEPYKNTLGLGFESGRLSRFIAQIDVPNGVPSGSEVRFEMRILGRSAGAMPTMVVERLVLPKATTLTSLPTSYVSCTYAPAVTFTTSDQYIDTNTSTFTVEPGDTVLIRVTRAAVTSGPAIHMIRQRLRFL